MNRKTLAAGAFFLVLAVSTGRATTLEYGDTPINNCTSMRIAGKCKPAPLSPEHNQKQKVVFAAKELTIKKNIHLPPQQFRGADKLCQVTYTTSYDQRNDAVRVTTGVSNPTCGKSHGEFEIRIKTRDEQGEPLTRSFNEEWTRDGTERVQLNASYPMGEATDLVWVRVHSRQRTACVCE